MKEGLSVLMPVYNEGAALAQSVRQVSEYLASREYDFEFVIVDDASTDDTLEIGRRLTRESPRVKLLEHPENQGPCSGLRTGPVAATKEWLLLLPADLAIPLEDIDALWSRRAHSDILLGYIARDDSRSLRRRVQSRVYTFLINLLFGLDLKQVNYVAMYRTALLQDLALTTSGVALHAEILVRAAEAGQTIEQVGLGYQPRAQGVASGSKPAVITKTFREIISLRRRLRG